MKCAKITIPQMSGTYKLYVYRSKSSDDINTISKVRTLSPIAIIDESTAVPVNVNGRMCYEFLDHSGNPQTGIEYLGPVPNTLPTIEYETGVSIVQLNDYTYVNQLNLTPLPIKYNGTMFYYSVIGVDEVNNLITHLSKVNGVMVDSQYIDGMRHLYSCDDNQNLGTDKWNYVSAIDWNDSISIGNILDKSSYDRFGCPVIEDVYMFDGSDVNVSTRPVTSNNFLVLEIPNVWQHNNKTYNYRKLKSYKVQNVYDEQYSEFSVPTYQSLLPVSIEDMIILQNDGTDYPDLYNMGTDTVVRHVIRRDGVYYNALKHKKLGLNKYNIPLEETTAVFSEGSVQSTINMQCEALPNHVYSFTVYIVDVYGNTSKPAQFQVTT